MPRLVHRLFGVFGLILGMAAVAPGCTVDVQSMLFVRQVQGLLAPQCAVDNSPESLAISAGTLDVAFRTEYLANLLVGSQLTARGAPELARAETSAVQITSAVVRVENSQGQTLSEYTIPVQGFIEASRAGQASYGVVAVQLIDSKAAAKLRAAIHPFVLRRTKEEVATDLPPKQEQVLELDLHPRRDALVQGERLSLIHISEPTRPY